MWREVLPVRERPWERVSVTARAQRAAEHAWPLRYPQAECRRPKADGVRPKGGDDGGGSMLRPQRREAGRGAGGPARDREGQQTEGIIAERILLSDVVGGGFDELVAQENRHVKILVKLQE